MFSSQIDERDYALKPMNCPGHIQIFNQGLKSYRDLPLRMAEFGCCHRYEPSGSLHGLMRVRHFNQDDAHIFCSEEQILSEVLAFNTLLFKIYKQFGFEEPKAPFAVHNELHCRQHQEQPCSHRLLPQCQVVGKLRLCARAIGSNLSQLH
jgi:threonyl-tRNA synthetase